ncbi:MAG: TonB-dependent receptor plug domain-containing protein, partial [Gammaproteobacteria bacterium]|nr:TonB-dependent receptor plug domain-containing protein [Gammaproteobacteria bacterium]
MSNLIGQLLRGLSCVLPLIALSAVAQDAGSGEGAESASGIIEELLVTARRREENVQEVPIPVTALSGQDLKDRAADEVRDLMRITPNMDFQQAGSAKNTAQVFLRGIGQVNWAPT